MGRRAQGQARRIHLRRQQDGRPRRHPSIQGRRARRRHVPGRDHCALRRCLRQGRQPRQEHGHERLAEGPRPRVEPRPDRRINAQAHRRQPLRQLRHGRIRRRQGEPEDGLEVQRRPPHRQVRREARGRPRAGEEREGRRDHQLPVLHPEPQLGVHGLRVPAHHEQDLWPAHPLARRHDRHPGNQHRPGHHALHRVCRLRVHTQPARPVLDRHADPRLQRPRCLPAPHHPHHPVRLRRHEHDELEASTRLLRRVRRYRPVDLPDHQRGREYGEPFQQRRVQPEVHVLGRHHTPDVRHGDRQGRSRRRLLELPANRVQQQRRHGNLRVRRHRR